MPGMIPETINESIRLDSKNHLELLTLQVDQILPALKQVAWFQGTAEDFLNRAANQLGSDMFQSYGADSAADLLNKAVSQE
jgi:hypothetical protein